MSEDGKTVLGPAITQIEIPEGITAIESEAFCRIATLKKVVLPSSLTEIGEEAFAACTELEEINIPASVETIGEAAFLDCGSLKKIEVHPDNKFFVCENGVFCTKDRSCIIRLTDSPKNESLVIGEDTEIHEGAIASCPSVKRIIYRLESLEDNTFYRCSNLQEVELGENIGCIGENAFYGCALESITLPESVEDIGEGAFASCQSLKSIVIPSQVEALKVCTFDNCTSLEHVTVGSGLIIILEDVFNGCPKNLRIHLPAEKTAVIYMSLDTTQFLRSSEFVYVPYYLAENIEGAAQTLNILEYELLLKSRAMEEEEENEENLPF